MAETVIIEVEGETPLAQCEEQAEQKDEFVTQLSKNLSAPQLQQETEIRDERSGAGLSGLAWHAGAAIDENPVPDARGPINRIRKSWTTSSIPMAGKQLRMICPIMISTISN